LNKNLLEDLYYKQYLSQKAIASKLGCSVDTVARNMQDYNMSVLSPTERAITANPICLTDVQLQVLNGALLGDGNLSISKNGVNACFCYSSKSLQHVQYIYKYFVQFAPNGIFSYEHLDKRTNKTYKGYSFRTITSVTFTEIYYAWYESHKNRIPKDLKLTPLTCLIWYIGDGGLIHGTHNYTNIKLATNCFDKIDIETILLPQLEKFEGKIRQVGVSKFNNQPQYVIFMDRDNSAKFLTYIGNCPFSDYKYKWEITERKNPNCKKYYEDWIQKYLSGVTCNAIAKEYGVDRSTIVYLLKQRGLYHNVLNDYKDQHKEWVQLYKQGLSYNEIAKKYHCNRQTVYQYIKRNKIKR
jgi:DNA invertase Pin-like site-specific DNA recombinase